MKRCFSHSRQFSRVREKVLQIAFFSQKNQYNKIRRGSRRKTAPLYKRQRAHRPAATIALPMSPSYAAGSLFGAVGQERALLCCLQRYQFFVLL
jgi:hypothetical protein